MAAAQTQLRRWVLLGAGQSHLLTLKKISKKAPAGVEIILIADRAQTAIASMFPAYVAGFYKKNEFYVDIESLCKENNIQFIHQKVQKLDTKNKILSLSNGEKIEYDQLSVDCGGGLEDQKIPGLLQNAYLLKPLEDYHHSMLKFCQSLRGKRKVDLVFIGAGKLAVETALALRQRLKIYGAEVNVHIVDRESRLASQLTEKNSMYLQKHCEELGFRFHFDIRVKEIRPTEVILANDQILKSDFTTLATPQIAQDFLLKSNLDIQHEHVLVNASLQSSDPHVFVVGDCALDTSRNWVRGDVQYAKQANVIVANMRAQSLGKKIKKFRPKKLDSAFIIDGEGGAIIAKGKMLLPASEFLWKLKDWIDTKFIQGLKVSSKQLLEKDLKNA